METTCGLVRASSASSSTSASSGDRPHLPLSSDLQAALEDVWQACLQLPTDSPSFEALSPDERRQAHDLGVQIQDRLLISLSRLVFPDFPLFFPENPPFPPIFPDNLFRGGMGAERRRPGGGSREE